MNVAFRDRLRLLAVADYQWGGQGAAVEDVLRWGSAGRPFCDYLSSMVGTRGS